jgi:16S rRNA (guanine(966)-N(2))-methyltransferase RsmD
MRIIQGLYKGFQFPVYHGSNTRPTSDLVKESLFNSLAPYLDIEEIKVLDLFAGTGNIGLECLSRGAASLVSVDLAAKNSQYMQAIKSKLQIEHWQIVKSDAIKFLEHNQSPFQLIFADPPYDYPNIHTLVQKVIQADWFLSQPSLFVLEHLDRLVFQDKLVFLKKQYGNTAFTCFQS